jgi:glutamate formiminotransferase
MNLTDVSRTPMHRVLELIRAEAARYGVAVADSEVIGLLPQRALVDAAVHYLQLAGFSPDQVLENWLMAEEDA